MSEMDYTAEMKALWLRVPGHDAEAHCFLALSKTGFRRACTRCRWLMLERPRFLALLQAFVPDEEPRP